MSETKLPHLTVKVKQLKVKFKLKGSLLKPTPILTQQDVNHSLLRLSSGRI